MNASMNIMNFVQKAICTNEKRFDTVYYVYNAQIHVLYFTIDNFDRDI